MEFVFDPWLRMLRDETDLPLYDEEAWVRYPTLRWCFNKLEICERQGIDAAPHGVPPTRLPVFSKPIINLWGLSHGAHRIDYWEPACYRGGFMWMTLLDGAQRSTDVVVLDGRVKWAYTMAPHRNRVGSFASWRTTGLDKPAAASILQWVHKEFGELTGVVNVETIGETIIEATPRLSTQFVAFYGREWIHSLARMMNGEGWTDPGRGRDGISLVDRVPLTWGASVLEPDLREVRAIAGRSELYGLCLPWYADQPLADSGGDDRSFRLSIVAASEPESAWRAVRDLRAAIQ